MTPVDTQTRGLLAWLKNHSTAADALLAVSLFAVAVLVQPASPEARAGQSTHPVDFAIFTLACGLVVGRRRWPTQIWLATTGLALLDVLWMGGPSPAILPALIGLYTAATHFSRPAAAAAGAGTAIVMAVAIGLVSGDGWGNPVSYAMLAWFGMAAAIGDATRSRRDILAAAEERARRAEQTREEEALRRVAEERVRIARELHDVVAHHISVINVQAGVADHLLTSDPQQARASLIHVRTSSQLVLTEMATILGLLRSPDEGLVTQPSPALTDVHVLVDAMGQAGLDVKLCIEGEPIELAPGLSLTCYRLVQEALTNAAKHGTGTAEVCLRFDPESLEILVSNPTVPGSATSVQAGHGITGMRERVQSCGGELSLGADQDSRFSVRATLPLLTPSNDVELIS